MLFRVLDVVGTLTLSHLIETWVVEKIIVHLIEGKLDVTEVKINGEDYLLSAAYTDSLDLIPSCLSEPLQTTCFEVAGGTWNNVGFYIITQTLASNEIYKLFFFISL